MHSTYLVVEAAWRLTMGFRSGSSVAVASPPVGTCSHEQKRSVRPVSLSELTVGLASPCHWERSREDAPRVGSHAASVPDEEARGGQNSPDTEHMDRMGDEEWHSHDVEEEKDTAEVRTATSPVLPLPLPLAPLLLKAFYPS